MRVVEEMRLNEFEAWSGAVAVLERLVKLNLIEWAESFLEEGTFTATQVNDFLWFDVPEIYEEEFEKDFWSDDNE